MEPAEYPVKRIPEDLPELGTDAVVIARGDFSGWLFRDYWKHVVGETPPLGEDYFS